MLYEMLLDSSPAGMEQTSSAFHSKTIVFSVLLSPLNVLIIHFSYNFSL